MEKRNTIITIVDVSLFNMATINVACPNCGQEALITVNSTDDEISKIAASSNPSGAYQSEAFRSACMNCEDTIYYWLE